VFPQGTILIFAEIFGWQPVFAKKLHFPYFGLCGQLFFNLAKTNMH
jgi:hypothetical protein